MSALFRDSALGQLVRYASNNKFLLYPEERTGFQCPSQYRNTGLGAESLAGDFGVNSVEKSPFAKAESIKKPSLDETPAHRPESIEELSPPPTPATEKDMDFAPIAAAPTNLTRTRTALSRIDTRAALEKVHTRKDLEEAYTTATLEKGPTLPIIPEKLDDGTILVDWYDTDDPENPQNWSTNKKYFVTFQIW